MRISRTPSPLLAWSAMLGIAAFGIGAATVLAQVPVPGRGGVSPAGVVPLDRGIAAANDEIRRRRYVPPPPGARPAAASMSAIVVAA